MKITGTGDYERNEGSQWKGYWRLVKTATVQVKDMSNLFFSCEMLEKVEFSDVRTDSLENMENMFCGARKLKKIDVSSFNTSKVTNMKYMFSSCKKLTSLDLSTFDTGNVTDMSSMFSFCEALKSVNTKGFKTDKVKNMESMFYYCKSMENIDLSHFKTGKLEIMTNIFAGCENLVSVNISSFHISNVMDSSLYYTFNGTYPKLKTINVPGVKASVHWPMPIIGNGFVWIYQPIGKEVDRITKAGIYEVKSKEELDKKDKEDGTLKKNATFTVSSTKYKVTKTGKSATVQYMGPIKKTAKTVKIPDTVTYKGTKYKVTSIAASACKNLKKVTKVTIGKNAFKGIQKKAVFDVPNSKKSTFKKLLKSSTGFKKKTMKIK